MNNKDVSKYASKLTVHRKGVLAAAIAACAAITVAGGLTIGHYAYKANHAIPNNHEIVLDPTIETEVKITEVVTTKEGNKQCEVRSYEKEIVDIKVTIGGVLLTKDVDYIQEEINDGTVISGYKVTVFRKTIDKYQGSINIVPKFNEGGSEELLKKIAELEKDIKAKEEEITKAKETIATKEAEIAAKDKEILEKTAAIEQLKGDVAKLQAELEAAEEAYKAKLADLEAKHAAEITKLKEEAKAAIEAAEKKGQEEVAKVKAEYDALIKDMEAKHAEEIKQLEDKHAGEIAEKEATIANLDQEIATLTATLEQTEADLKKAQDDLATAEATLEEQKEEIESLNEQLQEAQEALAEEQGKVIVTFVDKDFKNSGTFKITPDTTFTDAGETAPDPSNGYTWQDFDPDTTTFSTHTVIHEDRVSYNIDWATKTYPFYNNRTLYDIATNSSGTVKFVYDDSTDGTLCGETDNDLIYFTHDDNLGELKIFSKGKIQFEDDDIPYDEGTKLGLFDGAVAGGTSINTFDLTNMHVDNTTDFSNIFRCNYSIKCLDLSHWNTSKAVDMSSMFEHCGQLKSLNISNFDTSNVKYMNRTFNSMDSITTLNLSSFNTGNLLETTSMFSGDSNLSNICVGNGFDVSKVVSGKGNYMFNTCTKLVGGFATAYNENNIDQTYARLDDPDNEKPGYFSAKKTFNVLYEDNLVDALSDYNITLNKAVCTSKVSTGAKVRLVYSNAGTEQDIVLSFWTHEGEWHWIQDIDVHFEADENKTVDIEFNYWNDPANGATLRLDTSNE